MRARQILRSIAALLIVFATANQNAFGRNADWVVTIKTKEIEHCLNYPDSKISPVVKATVSFEQGLLEADKTDREIERRGVKPDIAVPPTVYEDIFFSHFRALGMHRYKKMSVKAGTPGTIKVMSAQSPLRQEEASAAANTTLRVFLDLYVQRAALRSVTVSRDIFDLYVQELQRYGFRIANVVPGGSIQAIAMIAVRSEPVGRTQYMSYGF